MSAAVEKMVIQSRVEDATEISFRVRAAVFTQIGGLTGQALVAAESLRVVLRDRGIDCKVRMREAAWKLEPLPWTDIREHAYYRFCRDDNIRYA